MLQRFEQLPISKPQLPNSKVQDIQMPKNQLVIYEFEPPKPNLEVKTRNLTLKATQQLAQQTCMEETITQIPKHKNRKK
jgi:hypothetical protein